MDWNQLNSNVALQQIGQMLESHPALRFLSLRSNKIMSNNFYPLSVLIRKLYTLDWTGTGGIACLQPRVHPSSGS